MGIAREETASPA